MRRRLWDTPYPRTMKSSDLCVRPGMSPAVSRTTEISLARQSRNRTVAVKPHQMLCCLFCSPEVSAGMAKAH